MNHPLKNISGSTLKWIAMLSMFCDHLAAVVLFPLLGITDGMVSWNSLEGLPEDLQRKLAFCIILRYIGRLAFPIYCFLLVEGLTHTHSRLLYLRNLLLVAVASEIPFDLAMFGKFIWPDYQNVLWTLVCGFLGCVVMDKADKTFASSFKRTIAKLATALIFAALAQIFYTDYVGIGVIAVIGLYCLRQSRLRQVIFGALFFLWEITAPLAFIFIYFYNGRRGRQMKWFFYWFYPAHLFLLYLLRLALVGW